MGFAAVEGVGVAVVQRSSADSTVLTDKDKSEICCAASAFFLELLF